MLFNDIFLNLQFVFNQNIQLHIKLEKICLNINRILK
jgi:hypothetical protein